MLQFPPMVSSGVNILLRTSVTPLILKFKELKVSKIDKNEN